MKQKFVFYPIVFYNMHFQLKFFCNKIKDRLKTKLFYQKPNHNFHKGNHILRFIVTT